MNGEIKIFYRYEAHHTCDYDYEDKVKLECYEYPVVKETPKGYWIGRYTKHRIPKIDGNKRYARDTKVKALKCYIYRTKKRILILRGQTDNSKEGIQQAQYLLSSMLKPGNIK